MGGESDIKVVLLGSEFVGKTCLQIRFIHERFTGLPYQCTIGAAFAAKKILSNGHQILLGVWDTAGSERYEAISRVYYRGAKAAIICYDPNDASSWTRLKHWVKELRENEQDCKIYICATKKDVLTEATATAIDHRTAMRYAQGIQAHYFQTSSRTGENITELFQQIADDFTSDPRNLTQISETIKLETPPPAKRCCS